MDTTATHTKAFTLAGHTIAPGERQNLAIPISHQVTGLAANLALQVVHGIRPGPVVFVSAAIHGDEIIGTAIIQKLIQRIDPMDMAGTLILAPAVNIFGFVQHSRYLPDRRDLNRSFPGNPNGSLAGQLAACFLENVIGPADLGIDLHTAAIHRYNLPQIRIAAKDPYLAKLAGVFGAPVVMESPLRPGSMRALAAEQGTPMLLLEAGEALRFDRLSIEVGALGIARVMAHLGMIAPDESFASVGNSARSHKSSWMRSPRGGVSHRVRKSGDIVHAGDVLAVVTGLFGEEAQPIVSSIDGIIIGHATLPVVHQGDAIFHVAEVAHLERAGERVDTITDAILAAEPDDVVEILLDEDEVL